MTGNGESGGRVAPVSLCHSPESADVIVAQDKKEGISQPGRGNETGVAERSGDFSPDASNCVT